MSGANPKLRHQSRLSAIQALYQLELTGAKSKAVVFEFLNHRFGFDDEPGMVVADEAFFEDLVEGVIRHQDDIDARLDAQLPEKWPLRRLDMTLRALLRVAVYEITQRPDVPGRVVIDQYVNLANEFFEGKEPGIANAVLDKIAKKVRAAEFGLLDATKGDDG